jgi:hypothetical protein
VEVIEDPVEARRRIDRFLERAAPRDVYGELLARGQVGRVLEDPEARKQLRSDLRRQARADKLRIITREYDDVVIALLKRPITPELKDEARNAIRGAYEAADVARRLGHQARVGSREHDEAVAYCLECGALGYADGSGEDLVLAGALYCDQCSS